MEKRQSARACPERIPVMALSSGCILCHSGAKMVLFVTGRCHRSCWYCPLSSARKGKDIVYANEHRINDPSDIIRVAESMSAEGTGVTGGEPLLVLDRVLEFCSLLKDHFGKGHQIHLYTAKAPAEDELHLMQGVIDEIRMHPPQECWQTILATDYIKSAKRAKELGFETGFEVPALPGLELLAPALPYLDFLNINELEWGETNADGMRNRGFVLADDIHNAVAGAREWAEPFLSDPKVHFCSSSFKDSVQLRERLKRIAKNTARTFDEITEDGTVVFGVLEPGGKDRDRCREILVQEFGEESFAECGDHFETAWWILAEDKDLLPGKKSVVEQYPDGGITVEVTPL
jgi:pyruvate formate-lyase activating enzyme-like uncharacterized protein